MPPASAAASAVSSTEPKGAAEAVEGRELEKLLLATQVDGGGRERANDLAVQKSLPMSSTKQGQEQGMTGLDSTAASPEGRVQFRHPSIYP